MGASKKKYQQSATAAVSDNENHEAGLQQAADDTNTMTDTNGVPDNTANAPADGTQPPEIASAEAEAAVWKDRYARLMADFDNFRKRQVRERDEIIKRANEGLILELLPVVDHFDLALAATQDPDDPFVTGVRIVAEQLHSALAKVGAIPVQAMNTPFTPEQHEALGEMPSDTVPAGHVTVQLRKGWTLAGRLLRPAQVIVSTGPATPVDDDFVAE